jgi:aminoglycoside phosphotransferase (APT) family kinase protein
VARDAGVKRRGRGDGDDPGELAALFERVVGPVLPPGFLTPCLAFLASFDAWAARQAAPEVILHNDLVLMAHALVDPATGALQGIIDFGDAAVGDPAVDLAALAVELPDPFLDAALEAYGDAAPGLRERALWRGRRYLLVDSVWMWEYGDDPEARERRLERIRHHFGHNPSPP